MRMRSEWTFHVLLRRAPAWVYVFLLLGCRLVSAEWDAFAPITDVSITNPEAGEVWLIGTPHTVSCTTSSDTDRWRECQASPWYYYGDTVTHYWTGSGSFKDNDNIGTSVTYICTDDAGSNTVTAYANDDYSNDQNWALVDEAAKSASRTVTVVKPQLEWVQFGGGSKHTLYKKDQTPWDSAGEDYATNYTYAVPDKAWVRSPALADPLCYTKNAGGGQVTASINFSLPQPLTEESTVNIAGTFVAFNIFTSDGVGVSGTSTTVPAMNMVGTFSVTPGSFLFYIAWSYKVPTGSNTGIGLGSSWNDLYLTWDTPGGSTRTAKRMKWVCEGAQGATSITQAAEKVADAAHAGTIFANQKPLNDPIWKALDPDRYEVDCGEGSMLAVYGLWMLGISTTQGYAWPTGGIPDGDKDASSGEITTCSGNHGTIYLRYEQSNGGYLNNYEGCFTVVDGETTKYLTVWDRYNTVADPWGRLKLLHEVKNDSGAFNQWWSYGEQTRVKDLHDHPNSVALPQP